MDAAGLRRFGSRPHPTRVMSRTRHGPATWTGMDLVTAFTRSTAISWCDLGQEIVVLRVRDNAYYRLDQTARDLWLSLDQPRTIPDLVESMCTTHEGNPARVEAETRSFLQECLGLELVTETPTVG